MKRKEFKGFTVLWEEFGKLKSNQKTTSYNKAPFKCRDDSFAHKVVTPARPEAYYLWILSTDVIYP